MKALSAATVALMIFQSCSIQRNIVLEDNGSGSERLVIHLTRDFFSEYYLRSLGLQSDSTLENVLPEQKSFLEMYQDSSLLRGLRNTISEDAANIKIINSNETYFADSSKNLEVIYSFNNVKSLHDRFMRMFKEDWDDTRSKLEINYTTSGDTNTLIYKLYSVNSTGYVMNDSIRENAENILNKIFQQKFISYKPGIR